VSSILRALKKLEDEALPATPPVNGVSAAEIDARSALRRRIRSDWLQSRLTSRLFVSAIIVVVSGFIVMNLQVPVAPPDSSKREIAASSPAAGDTAAQRQPAAEPSTKPPIPSTPPAATVTPTPGASATGPRRERSLPPELAASIAQVKSAEHPPQTPTAAPPVAIPVRIMEKPIPEPDTEDRPAEDESPQPALAETDAPVADDAADPSVDSEQSLDLDLTSETQESKEPLQSDSELSDRSAGQTGLDVQALVFSPGVQDRMAVVNGQIVRQGDAIDADTILVRIEDGYLVFERGNQFWRQSLGPQ